MRASPAAFSAAALAALLLALLVPAAAVPIHISDAGAGVVSPSPVPAEIHQDHEIPVGLLYGRHEAVLWVASEQVRYDDGRAHGTAYGLGYKAQVDTGTGSLTWYISTAPDAPTLTGFTVSVRLVAPGPTGGPGERAKDVYAVGTVGPSVLSPEEGEDIAGRAVHRFDVPLAWEVDALPVRGFQVVVETTFDPPLHTLADLGVHTSPAHRPGLDIGFRQPVRIEYLHPQAVDGDMVLHIATQTPWGPHGIRSVTAHATGDGPPQLEHIAWEPRGHCHCPPEARADTFILRDPPQDRLHVDIVIETHDGSLASAEAAWADGTVTVTMPELTHTTPFHLGSEAAPAPPFAVALLALGLLAGLLRRTTS